MKKIILSFIGILLFSGLSIAQTTNNHIYKINSGSGGINTGELSSIFSHVNDNYQVHLGVYDKSHRIKFFIGTTDFDYGTSIHEINIGRNNDPTFRYFPATAGGWSRFVADGCFAFFSNQRGLQNDSVNLLIEKNGNVRIGLPDFHNTTISDQNQNKYSLFVGKGVLSEDYGLGPKSTWADYVFNKDYNLMPLEELEEYVTKNKHLPNIPTAEEVKADGYSVHDLNVKLLEKIEELTLYTIEQNKVIEQLKTNIQKLEKQVSQP